MEKILTLSNYVDKIICKYESEGKNSAEYVRKSILIPELLNLTSEDTLIIDFSGMRKVYLACIPELFQPLVKENIFKNFNQLKIRCKEDEGLATDIMFFIIEAEKCV